MKCYYIDSVNGKTVFEPREAAGPQPKKGELLVRVRAASLDPGERLARISFHAVARGGPRRGRVAGGGRSGGRGRGGVQERRPREGEGARPLRRVRGHVGRPGDARAG